MKYYIVKHGTILYHGSSRLYQINCFIRSHWKELKHYLRTSKLKNFDPNNELNIAFKSTLKFYHETIHKQLHVVSPISKEVLYIMTVLLLQKHKMVDLSVYSIWNYVFDKDARDIFDLLDFAYEVEYGTETLDQLFEVPFYSCMRLPIQFFTDDKKKSSAYADDKKGGRIFSYYVQRDIPLLDLTDEETRDELEQIIFASTNTFPTKMIRYYTRENSIGRFRDTLLYQTYIQANSNNNTLTLFINKTFRPYREVSAYFNRRHEEIILTLDENDEQIDYANHWMDYFQIDIASPNGLWKLSNAPLQFKCFVRITLYESDVLILKLLVDDGRYQGYYNPYNNEFAIIDP